MITVRTSLPFGRFSPEPTVADALAGIGRVAVAATKEGIVIGYGVKTIDCTGHARLVLSEGSECGAAGGVPAMVGRNNGKTFEIATVLGIGGGGAPVVVSQVAESPYPRIENPVPVDAVTRGVWGARTGDFVSLWEVRTPEPWYVLKTEVEVVPGWFPVVSEGTSWFPDIRHTWGGGFEALTAVRAETPWRTWAQGLGASALWVMGCAVPVNWNQVEPQYGADPPTMDPAEALSPGCGAPSIVVWYTGPIPYHTEATNPYQIVAIIPIGEASSTPPYPETIYAWAPGDDGTFWKHVPGDPMLENYVVPPGINVPPLCEDVVVHPLRPAAPSVSLAASSSAVKHVLDISDMCHAITTGGLGNESHLGYYSRVRITYATRTQDFDVSLPAGTNRRLYRWPDALGSGEVCTPRLVAEIPNGDTTFLDSVSLDDLSGRAVPAPGPEWIVGSSTFGMGSNWSSDRYYNDWPQYYCYTVTCCIAGEWGRLSPLGYGGTLSDYYQTGKIRVTIPEGPAGTTARRLYRADRKYPNNAEFPIVLPSDYKLVAEIAGNSETTWDDQAGTDTLGGPPPAPTITPIGSTELVNGPWTDASFIDRVQNI